MTRQPRLHRTAALLTTLALGVLAVLVTPAAPASAAAVSFALWADEGTTTLPGGTTVPVLGYKESAGGAVTAPGGPVLEVNQGDDVTIVLTNQLAEDTSLLVQGQEVPPDLTGASAGGGSVTYTFNASHAGTYLYEAGLLPGTQYQTAMGLHGALVVHPGPAGQAYSDPSTAYDSDAVLVLSELDPALNNAGNPAAFDMRSFKPRYSLINGQAHPDVPAIPAAGDDTVLLRYLNAGVLYHSMGVLGASQNVIALDGSPLDHARHYTAETVGPGQTMDSLVDAPALPVGTHSLSVYDASLLLHNSNTGGPGGMYTTIDIAGTPSGTDDLGPVTHSVAYDGGTGTLSATVDDSERGGSDVAAAEFYLDDVTGSAAAMTGAFGSPTEAVSAAFSLGGGEHAVYVRGQDSEGNWGPFSSVLLTGSDVGGPTTLAPALNPAVTNHDSTKPGVAVSATADDSSSGNSTIAAAEYFIDDLGVDGEGESMTVNEAAPIASIDGVIAQSVIDSLGEGSHPIWIHSQDAGGNWGEAVFIDLDIDLTGPQIPASSTLVEPSPNNGTLRFSSSIAAVRVSVPTITDLGSNIVKAEMFLDTVGGNGSGIVLTASDGLFNEPSEGGYADIPLATVRQLSEGDHTISVHAKDAAGNWGDFDTATLVIDKTAPANASAASAAPDPTQGARSLTITATVSDDTINAAEWFVGANPGAGNGTKLTNVSTSAGTMTGTLDVSTFAEGSYALRLRVRDAAGNWSAGTTPVSFTVTAPVYFSTVGGGANNAPPGTGNPADDSDIYDWDGSSFSRVWDATAHGVPGSTDLDGFDRVSDTQFYASFAPDNTTIAGLGVVQDEDVVYYNDGTWSVFFDGTSNGLTGGNGHDIDAVQVEGTTLFFSTRGNGRPPGVTGPVDNADIYSWDGTGFARVFDATANGLPGAANVDGLAWLDATHFYLSFLATNTAVAGLGNVQDEDVVARNGTVWSVYFDGTGKGLTFGGEDIDAFDLP